MNRQGKWIAALTAMVVATAALQWRAEARRAAAPSGRPTVVAVVDIQRVINGLDELRDREGELAALGKELEARVEAVKLKLKDAEEALKVLPEGSPEFAQKFDELRRLTYDLPYEAKWAQQRIDEKRGEIYAGLFQKINDGAGRLARQSGFDLVLSSDGAAEIPARGTEENVRGMIVSRRVFFASESVDATDDLIAMLNNEHKMGGN
jgi:Skp family chaperone for outer membrane proteins